ncbi:MAG: DUF58 domain-containing protein [Puniceicoccales bacterium]
MGLDRSTYKGEKESWSYRNVSEEGTTTLPERVRSTWWRRILALIVPPRRQRNRPTLSGWLLILIAVGIGVAAYNTASNILFLVLSFVFALLIVNGMLSVLNFQKLHWELRLPSECRVGETVKGVLFISNRKRFYSTRAVWFVVRVGDMAPQRVFVRDLVSPGDVKLLTFSFVAKKRGRERIRVEGPESTYPFGFLRKQTGSYVGMDFLIWPALDPRPLKVPSPRETSRMGGVQRRVGSGTDLLQLRSYQKGDPLRRIHWKATARTGQLMVRQLADEGNGLFTLHIDCGETLWPEKESFELFLSRVSTLAGNLFTQNRLNGYFLNREEFRSVRHLSELNELNDRLALAETYPGRVGTISSGRNLIRFVPTEAGGVGLELVG